MLDNMGIQQPQWKELTDLEVKYILMVSNISVKMYQGVVMVFSATSNNISVLSWQYVAK